METTRILPFTTSIADGIYSLKNRRMIELLVLVVIVPLAYENLKRILAGDAMWMLYKEYWDSRETNNYLSELFKQNFVIPLSTVLMTTCFFTKYHDSKQYSKYLTIFIGASLSLLSMLMSAGGRKGLIQFVYIVILSWMASYYLKKFNSVYRIKLSYVLTFGVLAFVGISFASLGRGDENALFDVLLERISLYPALFEGYYKLTDMCEGFTFGYSMFETPIVILTYPFKLLGFEIPVDRISAIEQRPQFAPALGTTTNACVSAYLYYMRDFGVLGVALGPYIVGKIYNFLWKICRKP